MRFCRDDFFDVEDFNKYFDKYEEKIDALSKKVDGFRDSLTATGTLTSAGAVNLGWRPKAVLTVLQRYDPFNNLCIQFAVSGNPQQIGSASAPTTLLTVTDTGFTVGTGVSLSAANPLRYIAFR
jgi:hypothetical protein